MADEVAVADFEDDGLDKAGESLIGIVLVGHRGRPRKLELCQLDFRLAVVHAGRDLAPGAPLFDGLERGGVGWGGWER